MQLKFQNVYLNSKLTETILGYNLMSFNDKNFQSFSLHVTV